MKEIAQSLLTKYSIQDKVVSLELAKKMKERGWNFETERVWYRPISDIIEWRVIYYTELPQAYKDKDFPTINGKLFCYYPAPDAIEIINKLPDLVNNHLWHLMKGKGWWNFGYFNSDAKQFWVGDKRFSEKTLTECLGKMWLYLKEKKLI